MACACMTVCGAWLGGSGSDKQLVAASDRASDQLLIELHQ